MVCLGQLIDNYGEFAHIYYGIGTVNDIECSFEVGQLSAGTIYIYCETNGVLLDDRQNNIVLNGLTNDGRLITVVGIAIRVKSDDYTSSYFMSAGKIVLTVGESNWSRATCIRFGIVNFRFWGNEVEQITETQVSLNTLRLELDEIELQFRQCDGYKDIISNLQNQKHTDVTCELIIDIENRSQEEIFEFVEAVCNLLTIARGRKINWIYYKLTAENEPIATVHHGRITSPYKGYELIDFQSEETTTFLEQCYPVYKSLNPKYHFDRVANILVDCNSSGFIETRCLSIFSVVDSLVKQISNAKHFFDRIKDFVNYHHIPIEKREIKRFKNSRNKLTHQLEFDKMNNPQDEYIENLHFLHLMILGSLGYSSYYINVTKHPLWTGSRADKLTPTS